MTPRELIEFARKHDVPYKTIYHRYHNLNRRGEAELLRGREGKTFHGKTWAQWAALVHEKSGRPCSQASVSSRYYRLAVYGRRKQRRDIAA